MNPTNLSKDAQRAIHHFSSIFLPIIALRANSSAFLFSLLGIHFKKNSWNCSVNNNAFSSNGV